ncbi:hypothetical protein LguiA_020816 [Lonicera macranthoides]
MKEKNWVLPKPEFGDSISDTGNLISKGGQAASHSSSARPPYSQTYFHHPIGRCFDGLLIIYYIATVRPPPPSHPPYLNKNASFHHGANFTMASSTSLDCSFFTSRNIHTPLSNTPLRTQLDWYNRSLEFASEIVSDD